MDAMCMGGDFIVESNNVGHGLRVDSNTVLCNGGNSSSLTKSMKESDALPINGTK